MYLKVLDIFTIENNTKMSFFLNHCNANTEKMNKTFFSLLIK